MPATEQISRSIGEQSAVLGGLGPLINRGRRTSRIRSIICERHRFRSGEANTLTASSFAAVRASSARPRNRIFMQARPGRLV
jgi:hypothetical protein